MYDIKTMKTRDQGSIRFIFLIFNNFKKSYYFKLGKNVAPTVF